MEKLIPIINKLQDVFTVIGTDETLSLDLPQIVVVGSQSSGKSSVLEALVGRDFLPRGTGIVTRRPLVLQLIHILPGKDDTMVEWGEFLHRPNEPFHDFDKIREEIEKETDRITGRNKGISDSPINLKIYSPHVLNLTLIDLPGITRVPVGDQPPDVELQIRKIILRYIEKPNSIILAISAANSDLANSDALQVAKGVDPEGNRTIGVLTKLDIMDKGTDALEMLLGRVIPLKLGFIGIVNRSQHDIIQKKSIKEALKSEQQFFQTHNLYRSIASRCGTPYLAKTLNKILIQHIRDCLPGLKLKINKMLADTQQELASYGDYLLDSKSSRGALLLQIITKFCSTYRDAIDGKLTELAINELYGGARINYIFNEIFSKCLDSINPTEGLSTNDIRTAIRNATGPKASLFIPEVSFELLVKGQISRLEEPSIQCVELIHEELQRIMAQLESKVGELMRFPKLREQLGEVVNEILNKYRSPTKQMISNLIAVELAFINTNHPDFVGGDGAITSIMEKMTKNQIEKEVAQPQQSAQSQTTNAPSNLVSQPQQSKPIGSQNQQNGFLQTWFGPNQAHSSQSQSSSQQQQQPMKQQTQQKQNQESRLTPFLFSSESKPSNSSRGQALERLEQVPSTLKPTNTPTEKENFEVELIKYLLISYFDVVRKNIKDLVPKSIIHFLVNQSKDSLQNELVSSLYKEDLFDELLEESSNVAKRRRECQTVMEVLRKAHEILNEVRDFSLS